MGNVNLRYPQLIRIGALKLSDHNRSPLSVSHEKIELKQRMYNGTMRKFVIADKRSYSVSWNMLPAFNEHTVDKNAGAEDIESFFEQTNGKFFLYLTYDNNPENDPEAVECMLTNFSKEIVKRGITTFYDVTLSFEEV